MAWHPDSVQYAICGQPTNARRHFFFAASYLFLVEHPRRTFTIAPVLVKVASQTGSCSKHPWSTALSSQTFNASSSLFPNASHEGHLNTEERITTKVLKSMHQNTTLSPEIFCLASLQLGNSLCSTRPG